MEVIEITFLRDELQMSDDALGALCRSKACAYIKAKEDAKKSGYAAARAKLGRKVTIDGVEYASHNQARQALKMSYSAFDKMLDNAEKPVIVPPIRT